MQKTIRKLRVKIEEGVYEEEPRGVRKKEAEEQEKEEEEEDRRKERKRKRRRKIDRQIRVDTKIEVLEKKQSIFGLVRHYLFLLCFACLLSSVSVV